MRQNQYHCLVSGLPDLSFGEHKEWISMPSFREMLKDELHPLDFEQVKLALLKEDHTNLIWFLETGDTLRGTAGNFKAEDFRIRMSELADLIPKDDPFPLYMVKLLQKHQNNEKAFEPIAYSKLLAEGYYSFVMERGSPFMKTFKEFEYNLNNLLAFLKAGKFGIDQKSFITGDNTLADHLKKSVGRNLVRDSDFEFFDDISAYSANSSIVDSELSCDQLLWKIIDELVIFDYFTIDFILAYLQKMIIIRRWASLSGEKGEKRLRNLAESAREKTFNTHEIPEA